MGTRKQWAIDFAKALGNHTPSAGTIRFIAAWTKQEGTRARFNPLATTLNIPGATAFNSVGVRNYPTREIGIVATIKTLQGSHKGYNAIMTGIVRNNPEQSLAGLISSPWGSNGKTVSVYFNGKAPIEDENLLSEEGTGGGGDWVNTGGGGGDWGSTGGGGGDWTVGDDARFRAGLVKVGKVIAGSSLVILGLTSLIRKM